MFVVKLCKGEEGSKRKKKEEIERKKDRDNQAETE